MKSMRLFAAKMLHRIIARFTGRGEVLYRVAYRALFFLYGVLVGYWGIPTLHHAVSFGEVVRILILLLAGGAWVLLTPKLMEEIS